MKRARAPQRSLNSATFEVQVMQKRRQHGVRSGGFVSNDLSQNPGALLVGFGRFENWVPLVDGA